MAQLIQITCGSDIEAIRIHLIPATDNTKHNPDVDGKELADLFYSTLPALTMLALTRELNKLLPNI